jgi:hypothetical protein
MQLRYETQYALMTPCSEIQITVHYRTHSVNWFEGPVIIIQNGSKNRK